MLRIICFILTSMILFSCGSDEKEEIGGKPLIDNDFTNQFDVLTLRYTIADTTLEKINQKEKQLKIFGKKYFPDTLINKYFEPGSKITYYSVGKVQNDTSEIYVVMKAFSGTRKAAYVLIYDNQLNYKDGAMICQTDGDKKTSYYSSIDKFFNITIRRTDFTIGEEPLLTEVFLGYNNAGKLGSLVTNDTDAEIGLLNPIDTLRQTKKFTGDYYLDNVNLVSLRDSKDSGELILFFNYDKGPDCKGFIKDKIKFTGSNTAVYMKDGDPCAINFQFTSNTVKTMEEAGCGNKKSSFDCTLNATFTKATKKQTNVKKNAQINPLGATPPPPTTNPTPETQVPKTTTTKQPTKPKPKPATTVKPVVAKPTPKPTEPKKPVKQPDF